MMLLKIFGHQVRVARDGPTALQLACADVPELMLVDLKLPGMDGCEVARRARRTPELQEVVLVAFTGYGRDEDYRRTFRSGLRSSPDQACGSGGPAGAARASHRSRPSLKAGSPEPAGGCADQSRILASGRHSPWCRRYERIPDRGRFERSETSNPIPSRALPGAENSKFAKRTTCSKQSQSTSRSCGFWVASLYPPGPGARFPEIREWSTVELTRYLRIRQV
jgi:CheY-like chemotaxis protein